VSLNEKAVTERGGDLSYYDASGECCAAFGLTKDGQAGLSFSASRKKDRHIKMAVWKDGNLYLMLTESGCQWPPSD
jgi:hypothetical protein